MPIYRKRINGRKVWWVRVAHKGRTASKICETKPEARDVEPRLLLELTRQATQEALTGLAPTTVKALFEAYVGDLETRGKSADTIGRAAQTALRVQAVLPALLDKPVGAVRDADIYAFRTALTREGRRVNEIVAGSRVDRRGPAKPSTINRDLRTLRAMLKLARPDYRFPGGAFFPEDETRVRWLRPEEELLVLETMPSPFREIAKLAAMTLMRLSELRLLRRGMLHLDQGVILLPQAKAGARPVILSAEAQKILGAQLEALERARADAGGTADASGVGSHGRAPANTCFPGLTGAPTAAFISAACSARPRAGPGSRISTFTISDTTAPPWPSTGASRRRS
jgi:integrase